MIRSRSTRRRRGSQERRRSGSSPGHRRSSRSTRSATSRSAGHSARWSSRSQSKPPPVVHLPRPPRKPRTLARTGRATSPPGPATFARLSPPSRTRTQSRSCPSLPSSRSSTSSASPRRARGGGKRSSGRPAQARGARATLAASRKADSSRPLPTPRPALAPLRLTREAHPGPSSRRSSRAH